MISDLHRKGIASGRLMNRLRLYMREGTLQQMHSCSNVMLSSDHQPIEERKKSTWASVFQNFDAFASMRFSESFKRLL